MPTIRFDLCLLYPRVVLIFPRKFHAQIFAHVFLRHIGKYSYVTCQGKINTNLSPRPPTLPSRVSIWRHSRIRTPCPAPLVTVSQAGSQFFSTCGSKDLKFLQMFLCAEALVLLPWLTTFTHHPCPMLLPTSVKPPIASSYCRSAHAPLLALRNLLSGVLCACLPKTRVLSPPYRSPPHLIFCCTQLFPYLRHLPFCSPPSYSAPLASLPAPSLSLPASFFPSSTSTVSCGNDWSNPTSLHSVHIVF